MLWLKALHILAVISWMAGMLYLPRLLVYHMDAPVKGEASERFKIMERRLLKAIMTPAMIATWITGLAAAYYSGYFQDGWLHVKLLFVVMMSATHGFLAREVRLAAQDKRVRSSRSYRIINEVPTVFMVAIVFLAVLRPF